VAADFGGEGLDDPDDADRRDLDEVAADQAQIVSNRASVSDVPAGGRTHRINVLLDEEHAARLRRMAEQSHAAEGTLARSLLSRAIDDAEVDGRTIVEVLNGIPGARESIARGREQFARGEGVPLDEL
jgi:hypothetical protein